ncbi:YraN family protein [Carbonactinospora thermoautotrophica]|nr:YraN family protein [Carbonactinospora thermoautotrophica]KWX06085.1 hypothetical protein TH66_00075 [Carbonactinospora thermoautotrophica]KWX09606.1 hypothetical protein TR74_08605 [Carbonactinospora thermoautotrophica]MCX9191758.1 YraN family protein [Carbonactinospora thermoautotrophica]
MLRKDLLGRFGEEIAVHHLRESGLAILERNWRCSSGEIDIVARDGDELVICEVKTRSGNGYGTPQEAVTRVKAERLRRLAAEWLAVRGLRPSSVRFDVIAVVRRPQGGVAVEHLRGVM